MTPSLETLDSELSTLDNAGIAFIGVLSVAIATFGGPVAAAVVAGPIYFLIGPFKFGLGHYSAKARHELEVRLKPDATIVSTANTSRV